MNLQTLTQLNVTDPYNFVLGKVLGNKKAKPIKSIEAGWMNVTDPSKPYHIQRDVQTGHLRTVMKYTSDEYDNIGMNETYRNSTSSEDFVDTGFGNAGQTDVPAVVPTLFAEPLNLKVIGNLGLAQQEFIIPGTRTLSELPLSKYNEENNKLSASKFSNTVDSLGPFALYNS